MKKYNRRYAVITLVLCGMLFLNQPLEGQIVFGQPPAGELKFIYQSWSIEDTSGASIDLKQWVVPIVGFVPLRDNWEVIFTSSTAGTDQDLGEGGQTSLSGLNDTRLAVYGSFLEDQLLLGLGLNLPTGKKALNNDEINIVNYLTESFLNFPIKNYGEGFGLTVEAGYAKTIEIYSFGLGAGYTVKAAYEPLDGTDDYKPGNLLRLGAYGGIGNEVISGRLTLVYHLFGKDQLEDESIFRDGGIFDTRLEFNYRRERVSALLGARGIFRGKDQRIEEGELVTEAEKSHGTETRFYGQILYLLTPRIGLNALLEYKNVAANGYSADHIRSFGSSNYFGIGFGCTGSITKVVHSFADFKYYTGSADGGDLDLNGWQLALGIGATF